MFSITPAANAARTATTPTNRRRRTARRLRNAVLVGVMGTTAIASPAAAFDPPPINPALPPIEVPLCERSEAPDFCFPDYVAFASDFGSWPSVYEGVPARAFYITVRNESIANPGALWTTVSIDQGEILAIDRVWGRHDVVTAPVAGFDSEALWTIHHLSGLAEDGFTTFRVWVDTYDAIDMAVHTNWHAGAELFDEPGLDGYRHRESTRSNNLATTYG